MTSAFNERTRQVLRRFPAHLDVERPGKQIAHVVAALGGDFDTFASQVAGVRNAHRLAFAPTIRDLLLLGALHGVSDPDLSLVAVRIERLRDILEQLRQSLSAGGQAMADAASQLLDVFGIEGADERLAALSPAAADGVPPDAVAATNALLAAAGEHARFDAFLEATRRRIDDICRLHAGGNGTVRALLHTTLSVLDLEVDATRNEEVRASLIARGRTADLDLGIRDEFFHSADHFWHSTFVRDAHPLAVEIAVALPPADVLMGATIALAVLSQRSGVPVVTLIALARAAGNTDATFATRIPFDEADAIAAAEGFTVARVARGTLELNGGLPLVELARRLAVTPERVRADLAALAAANVALAATLTPQQVAIVARKFGHRVVLRPAPKLEALGIEENPLQREKRPPVAATHGQIFTVRRRGFGHQLLRIEIDGVDDLTVGPMLVNCDEGRGVGFAAAVPAGARLLVTEEGRVFLDGSDSTTLAFSWSGACFGGVATHARDFVFDGPGIPAGRGARFVEVSPAGGLNREALYPHAAGSLEVPGINVGETRFAFFVQQAHTGHRAPPGSLFADTTSTPYNTIAFADRSVFAGGAAERVPIGPHPLDPVAARVTLSWLEHEGYAVRVIVPSRFAQLSGGGIPVETRIVQALERVRPAGVEVRVEFADDRWTLGAGTLTDPDLLDDDPNDLLRGGTRLWPSPDDDS